MREATIRHSRLRFGVRSQHLRQVLQAEHERTGGVGPTKQDRGRDPEAIPHQFALVSRASCEQERNS